jgi:hypothetical protein
LAIDTCTFVADNFTEALELGPAGSGMILSHDASRPDGIFGQDTYIPGYVDTYQVL